MLALDPLQRWGSEGLAEGQRLDVDGLALEVVATPGHTSDSLSFLLPADAAVLTGDTVLGRGTTVVAHPDGRLADYLESLQRLGSLAHGGRIGSVLPGHGPALDDATAVIDGYLAHRSQRLEQVRCRGGRRGDVRARGGGGGLRRRRPLALARGRAVGAGPARVPQRPELTATSRTSPLDTFQWSITWW